jgi:hypothetical protein
MWTRYTKKMEPSPPDTQNVGVLRVSYQKLSGVEQILIESGMKFHQTEIEEIMKFYSMSGPEAEKQIKSDHPSVNSWYSTPNPGIEILGYEAKEDKGILIVKGNEDVIKPVVDTLDYLMIKSAYDALIEAVSNANQLTGPIGLKLPFVDFWEKVPLFKVKEQPSIYKDIRQVEESFNYNTNQAGVVILLQDIKEKYASNLHKI